MLWIFSVPRSIVGAMHMIIRPDFPGFFRQLRIFIPLIMLLVSSTAGGQTGVTTVGGNPDISWRTYSVGSPNGQVTVHMVLTRMDGIREGRVSVECAMGGSLAGQTASPERIGRDYDALAAMNGPYFASAGSRIYPLGFTAINGKLIQLGSLTRPMVGIDDEGEFIVEVAHPQAFVTSEAYFEPVWLWGINAPAGADAVTMYDRLWGSSVSSQGGVAVAVAPVDHDESEIISIGQGSYSDVTWDGEVIDVCSSGSVEIPEDGYVLVFRGRQEDAADRYEAGSEVAVWVYDLPDGWESMRWIATLGPWFVHDGWVRDYDDETDYGGNITGRSNRSIIGLTWNNELFFAVTRGPGLSVRQAADVMIECNVREAIMCDSGSSSGMWAQGIGAKGASRGIPLGFIVRESMEEPEEIAELRVWEGTLFRH